MFIHSLIGPTTLLHSTPKIPTPPTPYKINSMYHDDRITTTTPAARNSQREKAVQMTLITVITQLLLLTSHRYLTRLMRHKHTQLMSHRGTLLQALKCGNRAIIQWESSRIIHTSSNMVRIQCTSSRGYPL